MTLREVFCFFFFSGKKEIEEKLIHEDTECFKKKCKQSTDED